MRTLVVFLFVCVYLNFNSCVVHTKAEPTKVVVVKTPPKHYKIVKVKGKRYYFWNGKHYKKTRKGYIVVRV